MSVLGSDRNSGKISTLFEFTQGIAVDRRLAHEEITVQRAWAQALSHIGILTENDFDRIVECLALAEKKIANGTFQWRSEDEDIHMNLERFVTENLSELGKKMHVGRSRNDLIATTLRLYAANRLEAIIGQCRELCQSLVTVAESSIDVLIPGLTHVQHGQPIRLAHFYLAHAQAFARDVIGLTLARANSLAEMPLGAAALSGTPLKISLADLAKNLGFAGPCANSYDAVGNRDFMLRGLSALSLMAVHLSRFAEDIIYYSSTGVGLLQLPRDWSTGSSIMPNKRNPDVAELVRGRSAHIMGAANEAYMLMKSVPTSYASDLHELKGVFMRGCDEAAACLEILPHFVRGLSVKQERATELLNRGHILATEIADALVESGQNFRDAYKAVATLVEEAEKQGKQVHEIVADQVPALKEKSFSFESAVEKRSESGGTGRAQVEKQITQLKSFLT